MHQHLDFLRQGLRDFGLNPSEWVLNPSPPREGVHLMQICSRDDRLVMFEGWADRGHWLKVFLVDHG